jgi:hypothetical protein
MKDVVTVDLTLELTSKLTHFKEYAVSHPQLLQVDKVLMQAIQEPAGSLLSIDLAIVMVVLSQCLYC